MPNHHLVSKALPFAIARVLKPGASLSSPHRQTYRSGQAAALRRIVNVRTHQPLLITHRASDAALLSLRDRKPFDCVAAIAGGIP